MSAPSTLGAASATLPVACGRETYRIQIEAPPTFWRLRHIAGEPVPDSRRRAEAVQSVARELASFDTLLPAVAPRYLRRVVVVGSTIHVGDRRVGGVYLDEPGVIVVSAAGLPDNLAHELFHSVDAASGTQDRDPAWVALNPRGVSAYTGFRPFDRAAAMSLGPSRPAGFVRDYGRVSPAEDKATLFEACVDAPEVLGGLAKHDPVLRRKIEALRRRLPARTLPHHYPHW